MSTPTHMTQGRLDAIRERVDCGSPTTDDVSALLAEVERLKPFESIVSWRYGDTTDGRTREDMVTRAVEAHHAAFNAWPVKRSLEDSYHRRVAAMRAALDAALGTGEGA